MYCYDGDVVLETERSKMGIAVLLGSVIVVLRAGILPSTVLRLSVALY